jgi:hypothetical protein
VLLPNFFEYQSSLNWFPETLPAQQGKENENKNMITIEGPTRPLTGPTGKKSENEPENHQNPEQKPHWHGQFSISR